MRIYRIFYLIMCFACLQGFSAEKAQLRVDFDKIFSKRNHAAVENLNCQFLRLQKDFFCKLGGEVSWVGIVDGGLIRKNIYIIAAGNDIYFFKNKCVDGDMDLGSFRKIRATDALRALSGEILGGLRENKIRNKFFAWDCPIILVKFNDGNSGFGEKAFYFHPDLGGIYNFASEVEMLAAQGGAGSQANGENRGAENVYYAKHKNGILHVQIGGACVDTRASVYSKYKLRQISPKYVFLNSSDIGEYMITNEFSGKWGIYMAKNLKAADREIFIVAMQPCDENFHSDGVLVLFRSGENIETFKLDGEFHFNFSPCEIKDNSLSVKTKSHTYTFSLSGKISVRRD